MSQPYQGRHRARHRRQVSKSSSLVRAVRRPAVTSSLLLAVVATTAAGYQAADNRQTGAAAFTVSTEAIDQANELADAQIEDSARLAADRNDTNASIWNAGSHNAVANLKLRLGLLHAVFRPFPIQCIGRKRSNQATPTRRLIHPYADVIAQHARDGAAFTTHANAGMAVQTNAVAGASYSSAGSAGSRTEKSASPSTASQSLSPPTDFRKAFMSSVRAGTALTTRAG